MVIRHLHGAAIWTNIPTTSNVQRTTMARRSTEFEKSFEKLEKIVHRLENEELSLDESLKLFEDGIGLSRFCHAKLEEVERKIELILADAKGEPKTEPFEEEPEEDAD